ncbi:MAG: hypothetical protein ACLVJ6_05315 [Merdibacter sp.]
MWRGELGNYTLTVTVERSDNGESGSVTSVYTVRHATHDISEEWKMTEETHYKECLNCVEIFAEAEHSFVWVTDQEPAIGIVGYRHEECSICGFEKEPVEIPALEEERPIDPDDGKPGTRNAGQVMKKQMIRMSPHRQQPLNICHIADGIVGSLSGRCLCGDSSEKFFCGKLSALYGKMKKLI